MKTKRASTRLNRLVATAVLLFASGTFVLLICEILYIFATTIVR